MNGFARSITIAASLALTSQPCLAAVTSSSNTKPAAETINFSLARQPGPANMASMTLAASQQTAEETEEKPRRKGPGTTTLLVVGGVLLLVVVVVAVGSATFRGPLEY